MANLPQIQAMCKKYYSFRERITEVWSLNGGMISNNVRYLGLSPILPKLVWIDWPKNSTKIHPKIENKFEPPAKNS